VQQNLETDMLSKRYALCPWLFDDGSFKPNANSPSATMMISFAKQQEQIQ